jgi:hypothetical protein
MLSEQVIHLLGNIITIVEPDQSAWRSHFARQSAWRQSEAQEDSFGSD